MKSILLIALAFCFSLTVKSNDFADGYILLAGKDTVTCKIKIGGKRPVTNYTTVVTQTIDGVERVYRAKEGLVLAYGYKFMGVRFDYRFAEIQKTYESGFFRLIDDGEKYKLYVTMISDQNNGVVTTQPFYALFKPNGEYVDLTTHLSGNWKRNLRKILNDNPEALKEVENISRKDIPDFIKKLNKIE